ncbi:hypothetical protein [Pseudoalteromonas sp. T1lg75]|uniref:hypothetical protein n=1 Tax=Pseudoalteromonas sp. T1lg75 TaxID=2077102 RepID=UPI000CF6D56E|nr:hypothetical protein [Pseudoalteromonas sp. T1lg75]
MINTLRLRACGDYSSLGEVFEVLIDGTPLLELVTQFEQRFDPHIGGAYRAALSLDDISKRMLENKATLMPLACDCGQWECWYLLTQVYCTDDYVCWKHWHNPYRDAQSTQHWDYREFDVFTFDKTQYQAEIVKALR